MSKIEAELVEATGVKASKDRPKFLKSLHTAVMKLSDDAWDKLSPGAQTWANAGTKALEKEEAIADFTDAKAAAKPVAAEAEAEEEPAPAKAPAKKPAAKPKAAEPEAEAEAPAKTSTKRETPKAAAPKPAPVKKGPGKIEQMKALMLKNLTAKPEDLKAKLTAAGLEGIADSTITTVRSDFLSSIRVLQRAGALSADLVELD